MNENRQIFVNTYLTNGYDATDAYRVAYPKCKSGHQQSGSRLLLVAVVKQSIDKAKKDLKEWMSNSRELCDRLFRERFEACVAKNDNTNAIRCVENKAKNVGYYAIDNAQRTEQTKLTEEQEKEAKAYAKWRLLRGLDLETKDKSA